MSTYSASDAIPVGVVLKPTEKEFKNFKSYLYSVLENPIYKDAGCIKVNLSGYPAKDVQV